MTFLKPTTQAPTLSLAFDDTPAQPYFRILLKGYPKGGKTRGALDIASVIAGDEPFPVINTEKNGVTLYRKMYPRAKVINLSEDTGYNGLTYVEAMKLALTMNPRVIVIDSISPAWNGLHGVLDEASESKSDAFYVWKKPKEKNRKLLDLIQSAPCHVIATVRSKTKLLVDEKTKEVKKRPGSPIQWNEIEFEFDLNIDYRDGGIATVTGSRLTRFDVSGDNRPVFNRDNQTLANLILKSEDDLA